MADLTFYLFVLLGFILSFFIVIAGSARLASGYLKVIEAELILKIVYFSTKLLLVPIHKSGMLIKILSFKYAFDGFYAGAFLGYLLAVLVFSGKARGFNRILFNQEKFLYQLIIICVGVTYICSGLGAILGFDRSLAFFKSCGYSEDFMVFIIAIELLCGIGVFFRRLRMAAALVLMIDMAGATLTHFHNYFSKGLPDPLGNSLPSLSMQVFLISMIMMGWNKKDKEIPDRI
jgi:uncharacterized membrane protein YphA (DoxX/SURF4 family)